MTARLLTISSQRRRARRGAALLSGALATSLALSAAAQDDPLTKEAFALDDRDPEGSVPSPKLAMDSPLKMGYFVMLLLERAKAASERGDHLQAIKYYRALVKALPERATSHTFLCRAYEAAGDYPGALQACKQALGASGVTVEDNLHFVSVALAQPAALAAGTVADVEAVAAHLEGNLADKKRAVLVAEQIRCDLALRLDDVTRLTACTSKLASAAPSDPRTLAFTFALNLKERDFQTASRTIAAARRAELPADAVARMEQGLQAAQAVPVHGGGQGRWVALAAGVLAALVTLAAFLTRRKRVPAAPLGAG